MTAGSSMGRTESADVRRLRADLKRAVRRLNVLEVVLMGAAVVVSLGGGWLAALLGSRFLDLPFGATWIVASFAFFVVPGLIALGIRAFGRASAMGTAKATADRSQGANV